MYLARWILMAHEYRTLKAYDNYVMHQLVCEIFDQSGVNDSEKRGVKFEVTPQNGSVTVLIQSEVNVVNHPLIGRVDCKEIDLGKYTNGRYRISVNLNAVKQVRQDGKKNPRRVSVVGEANITEWLKNRESSWGMTIDTIKTSPTSWMKCIKGKTHDVITVAWHKVDMICTVSDSALFHVMIHDGIGKSRAFGCSMVKFVKVSD